MPAPKSVEDWQEYIDARLKGCEQSHVLRFVARCMLRIRGIATRTTRTPLYEEADRERVRAEFLAVLHLISDVLGSPEDDHERRGRIAPEAGQLSHGIVRRSTLADTAKMNELDFLIQGVTVKACNCVEYFCQGKDAYARFEARTAALRTPEVVEEAYRDERRKGRYRQALERAIVADLEDSARLEDEETKLMLWPSSMPEEIELHGSFEHIYRARFHDPEIVAEFEEKQARAIEPQVEGTELEEQPTALPALSPAERHAAVMADLKELNEAISRDLEPHAERLRAILEGLDLRTFGSQGANEEVVNALAAIMRRLEMGVECPKDETPSLLRNYPGKGEKDGNYRFLHLEDRDGKQKQAQHGGFESFADLKLVPRPYRWGSDGD